MIQATRMAATVSPSLRFGSDSEVLKTLQKIAENPGNYNISVQLNSPTRNHNTIYATNKRGLPIKIVAHFLGRNVRIEAAGLTFNTTEKAAGEICKQLVADFAPKTEGGSGGEDVDT
jgi:hypothetical protein